MKKGAFIVSILLLGLLLAGGQISYAGPNPGIPANSHLSGPAIVGTITISPTSDPGYWAINFSGNCKGNPVIFSASVNAWYDSISYVTESDLDQQLLLNAAPQSGCAKEGVTDLIINTISKFTKTDTAIQAEAVIMQIVYQ